MNLTENFDKTFEVESSVRELLNEINKSDTVQEACVLLEKYLLGLGHRLLSVKFCDTKDEQPPIRPFVRYPSALSELSENLSETGGCPISREALHRLTPFDALDIDSSRYADFMSKRFLEELAKLDYLQVAVIPVLIGRGFFVCNIGVNDGSFVGEAREELVSTICIVFVNILRKFEILTVAFRPKRLSLVEAEIILLLCNGNTLSEVAASVGFSEFAVIAFLEQAKVNMKAKTVYHLIAKAVAQGEVPNLLAPMNE